MDFVSIRRGLLRGLARGLGMICIFYAGYGLGTHQSTFLILGCALLGQALVSLPDNVYNGKKPKCGGE